MHGSASMFDILHAHPQSSARCSQWWSTFLLTFDTHPGKISLPWDSPQCPTLFFISWRRPGPITVTELNPLPFFLMFSLTALNPVACIVRLSSPLAFPVAKQDALICLEATTLTMKSSARGLHHFFMKETLQRNTWWFVCLWPQSLPAKHKDCTHQKPEEAELNNMCREIISHGSPGTGLYRFLAHFKIQDPGKFDLFPA